MAKFRGNLDNCDYSIHNLEMTVRAYRRSLPVVEFDTVS